METSLTTGNRQFPLSNEQKVIRAHKSTEKISELSIDRLRELIRGAMALCNINTGGVPITDDFRNLILSELVDEHGFRKAEEVQMAFKFYARGKLKGDGKEINHFGTFSAEFMHSVIRAYFFSDERAKVMKKLLYEKPEELPKPPKTQEQIDKENQILKDIKYKVFKVSEKLNVNQKEKTEMRDSFEKRLNIFKEDLKHFNEAGGIIEIIENYEDSWPSSEPFVDEAIKYLFLLKNITEIAIPPYASIKCKKLDYLKHNGVI